MDRQLVYAGAIPQNTDVLSTNKNVLYGLGHIIQAALGTGTSVVGLVGAQSTIPDLHITVGPGAIYSSQTVDASAYGDLGTDANTVMKQGILKAAQTLTLTPPGTSGYSQVYLVEATYSDTDGGATVLPYYNSSNPSAPYAGPANAGTSNFTVRQGLCTIALKAGTAAPTGSQTTPSADSGYVPLYTITLANGQTAITNANIITVPGAPFVPYNLNNLPFLKSQTDTGTANELAVTEPAISALFIGLTLTIKKSSSANTSAATLNVNGLGATALVWADGTALVAGDWPASVTGIVEYDGTQWNLLSVMGPSVWARRNLTPKYASQASAFTANVVLSDINYTASPPYGNPSTSQTLAMPLGTTWIQATGVNSIRNNHATIANDTRTWITLSGSDSSSVDGPYVGSVMINGLQAPLPVSGLWTGLNPAVTYTLKLNSNKGVNQGPCVVLDARLIALYGA